MLTLGIVNEMPGNYSHAESYLEKAKSLDPVFHSLHFKLGIVRKFQEKLEAVAMNYRKAITLQRNNPAHHFPGNMPPLSNWNRVDHQTTTARNIHDV